MIGRAEIASMFGRIFADHRTAPYISTVRSVRLLSPEVAILRAIVGMVVLATSHIRSQKRQFSPSNFAGVIRLFPPSSQDLASARKGMVV